MEEGAARVPGEAVERLVPYVPRISLEWLSETPEARHRQIEGTLAFVDISGFTELTERLSRKGKIGAEEMNDLLGGCFTEFLSVAYDYGAGVVKWGGDAVLLLFEGDEHEARACRAAHEMQRTMRSAGRLRTSSGAVTLRMSVGIHSGAFDFFLVGDLHRELVVTGPGATTTVEMEAAAEAGEIAISAGTAAALDPACLGATRGRAVLLARGPAVEPRPTLRVGEVTGVPVELCVPIDIREHLLAGASEAEHRPLTAAFVHFGDADGLLARAGPEALAGALEQCLGVVQRTVREHGVAFFDTDIAANGGKIILIAGAPRSSGNEEERMLRAMGAVMAAGSPLPLRIGVNRGRIFVADFGPPYRRTYSVKGDAVNLAARLMAKAEPGQILVARDVLDRARTRFDVAALEPFVAKGRSEPVHAYVLGPALGAAESAGEQAPLVGREAELDELLGGLERLREGSGSIVELVGEPGLGKSRLIEELRLRADGVPTVSVECDEYGSSTPYLAFRALLRELLALTGEEDAGQVEHALRSGVESRAPHLVPWLPLLGTPLGLELPDTAETSHLDERFRRDRVHEVTAELLGMFLLEPALLVFEDTHWMDEASAGLLRHLAGQLALRPWMIVATRREQASGFAASPDSAARRIELQPLAPDQAGALLLATTEETPLRPHELEALAARSGGNPLFLGELLAAARQAGGVDALPDSVESLLMAQIDRLAPGDRRLLRCAAVIGAVFTTELLAEALRERPDRSAWDRLADFLVDHGDGQVRFRHALVRDAAYEGLPYRRRRELHRSVGEALERRLGDDPGDEVGMLSLHFFHAGELVRAWRYSRIAGDRAERVYANVEAAGFYERALQAAGRLRGVASAEVAAVAESLGDVRVRLGEFEAAGEAFRASRRHLPADPVEDARLVLKHALIPWRLGRYPQALRWLTRGLRIIDGREEQPAVRQRAGLYAWKGVIRQKQGYPLEAIKWCRRAIAAAEASGAREALAQAFYMLDWAYAALGRFDEAVYSQRALAIYEELGDLERQALILNNLGVLAHRQGRWGESIALYERAQRAWEEVGDRWSASFAVVNRAEVLLDQGRLDEAEPLMKKSLRIARASRSGARIADVAGYYGRLLARLGRFEEAASLLAEAHGQYERDRERGEVLATEARIAESLVLSGAAEDALHQAERTLARVGTFEGIFVLVPTLQRARGLALIQLGRPEEAREALTESLRRARLESADYDVALALDALAALPRLGGEPREGIERERDSILEKLGVVATPEIPLPLEAGGLSTGRSA